MKVTRIIEQSSHRNGVGGHPAVISLFEVDNQPGVFLATTLTPDCDESLTPDKWAIERYGEEQAYANRWLAVFAEQTVVLSLGETVKLNIAFAEGNSWRGADECGQALAEAWRAKQLADVRYGGPYDPATEWFRDQHFDPDELARLKAENDEAVDELLGRSK